MEMVESNDGGEKTETTCTCTKKIAVTNATITPSASMTSTTTCSAASASRDIPEVEPRAQRLTTQTLRPVTTAIRTPPAFSTRPAKGTGASAQPVTKATACAALPRTTVALVTRVKSTTAATATPVAIMSVCVSEATTAHLKGTLHKPQLQWLLFIWISCLVLNVAESFVLDRNCIRTCMNLQKHSIPQHCPLIRTCDWQCEADTMTCSGQEKYHCAILKGSNASIRLCAVPKLCLAGEEPIIVNRSIIECSKCPDNYYNPTSAISSSSSGCPNFKNNQCTQKKHKKDCGLERYGVPWDKNRTSDGFCRCDARAGYTPVHDLTEYKDEYCFSVNTRCENFTCPSGMERSLNYMCIPKCPDGLYRTELSDECVNNTTLSSSPPIFVTATKKPSSAPATSPPPELIPPEPAPQGSSNKAVIIVPCVIGGLLSIVGFIICCCKKRLPVDELCNLNCGNAEWRCCNRKSQYSEVSTSDQHPPATERGQESDSSSPTCIEINTLPSGEPNTGEENGSNNHADDSANNVTRVVNELQNNGDYDISGNANQSDTSEDSSSKNDRKKKGSRKRGTKKTLNNKIRINVEGDLIVHHNGSSSQFQVEELDRLIEKTTDTPCSDRCKSKDQEDSVSEDTEIDTTNSAPDATENDGTLSLMEALLTKFKKCLTEKWTKVTEIDCPAVLRQLKANAITLGVNLKELMTFPKKLAQPAETLHRCNSRNIPTGFVAYKTTGKNNSCLYQAISILMYGDESHQLHLRLCCAIHAVENMALYKNKFEEHFQNVEDGNDILLRVQQVFTCYGVQVNGNRNETCHNWKDLLDVLLFKLLVEICDTNSDSSQLHVRILGNAIGCEMIEHFETVTDPNPCKDLHLKDIHKLNGIHSNLTLTIFWCRFTQDSIGELNHILPLLPAASYSGSDTMPIAENHFGSYPTSNTTSRSQGSYTENFDSPGSSNNGAIYTQEQNGNYITENSGRSSETLSKTSVIDPGDSGVCNAATNGETCTSRSVSDCKSTVSVEEPNVDVVQEAISTSGKRKNVEDRKDIEQYAGEEWGLNNTTACVLKKLGEST